MALGIQLFATRTTDGGPHLAGDEELVRVERGASVALGRRQPESPGSLFITTKRVIWLSDVEREKGYAVDFVSISLHAVSRDPEAYPQPCIYAQIERESEEEEEESEGSDSESQVESFDLLKISEMRFIPSDPNQLDSLFAVFCQCAELNPDPNAEMGEEEENSWVYGEDMAEGGMDWQTLNPIGHANGDHIAPPNLLNLQINDERFEDAEESENGSNGH